MKVICCGDSNTWGYDPRGPFGDRYDHPWPELLREKTGWNVINEGENGRTIPGTADIPEDTDLLIVMLGTNDLLQFSDPDAVCSKMERFLTSLAIVPQKILLLAPPPMKPGAWVDDPRLTEHSRSLACRFNTLAERLGTRFADPGQLDIRLSYDGVHLTEADHQRLADALYRHLRSEAFPTKERSTT